MVVEGAIPQTIGTRTGNVKTTISATNRLPGPPEEDPEGVKRMKDLRWSSTTDLTKGLDTNDGGLTLTLESAGKKFQNQKLKFRV